MNRNLASSKREIQVKYSRRTYRMEVSWQLANNGQFRYCYAKVFVRGYSRPIHRWAWLTDPNGHFMKWV